MSALLEVDELVVRYGAVVALDGTTLRAEAGRVTAVIGPNGAGKTTLLRTLSGLHRAASGAVRFGDVSITRSRAHTIARSGLVHVPEGRGIVAPLSVEENLLIGAGRASAADVKQRIAEQLALFPALERRLRTSAGLLSGGEQQMLAIARGLMSRPQLLAIDEPSMGLAPVVVKDVLAALHTTRASGVAVLLIEQNVALARELADHLYVIANGRVVAGGTPDEIPTDLMSTYLS